MTEFQSRKLFSNKMALNSGLFVISLIFSLIGSNAAGELSILHSPVSLSFRGSSVARESSLKDIFCASLGLSVEENSQWDGLIINDPFNTPEAVVEVYIDGIPSLRNSASLKGVSYGLVVDEYEPDTYDALKHRIKQRFTNGGNNLVNIRLSDLHEVGNNPVFGEIKVPKVPKQSLQHLKHTVDEDFMFLSELENLKAITKKVNSGIIAADNIADFYNLRFVSLHALSDFHGPNSLQAKEAKKLLGEALEELTAAFVRAYDGAVLMVAACSDVAHTRRVARSVNEPRVGAIRDSYTADYAAIFNIILWFGVIFTFTLVAIVYALMDMDPGRDSIIYRMTSTRMKKDN